jgi:hypothetical protein
MPDRGTGGDVAPPTDGDTERAGAMHCDGPFGICAHVTPVMSGGGAARGVSAVTVEVGT